PAYRNKRVLLIAAPALILVSVAVVIALMRFDNQSPSGNQPQTEQGANTLPNNSNGEASPSPSGSRTPQAAKVDANPQSQPTIRIDNTNRADRTNKDTDGSLNPEPQPRRRPVEQTPDKKIDNILHKRRNANDQIRDILHKGQSNTP